MPDIDFAFLADAAETIPGQKFHVLGGGIARIGGRRFPLRHPHLALVIGLQVTAPETDREHEIRFVLLDPDGGEVAGATGSLVARSQRDGRDAILTFSIDLWNLTFPAPGDYSFRILVNGSERKRLPLLLLAPPDGADRHRSDYATGGCLTGLGATRAARPATSCRRSTSSRWSRRGTPTGCWPRRASAAPTAGSRTSSRCRTGCATTTCARLRSAAHAGRAAYGPKDSVRDALPPDVTEPFLDAIDRLLRELARESHRTRR